MRRSLGDEGAASEQLEALKRENERLRQESAEPVAEVVGLFCGGSNR